MMIVEKLRDPPEYSSGANGYHLELEKQRRDAHLFHDVTLISFVIRVAHNEMMMQLKEAVKRKTRSPSGIEKFCLVH